MIKRLRAMSKAPNPEEVRGRGVMFSTDIPDACFALIRRPGGSPVMLYQPYSAR